MPLSSVDFRVSSGSAAHPIRARMLRAATELMALKGTVATTVRDISQLAGQNVAAVNYYFGSKEALTREVLYAALAPVNAARIAALDVAQATEAASLEAVLDALLRPLVEADRAADGGRTVVRLLNHIRAVPLDPVNAWLSEQFDTVVHRFIDALTAACPSMDRADVIWRYEFIRGATMHILADLDPRSNRLGAISGGACNLNDDRAVLMQLLAFATRGFTHP